MKEINLKDLEIIRKDGRISLFIEGCDLFNKLMVQGNVRMVHSLPEVLINGQPKSTIDDIFIERVKDSILFSLVENSDSRTEELSMKAVELDFIAVLLLSESLYSAHCLAENTPWYGQAIKYSDEQSFLPWLSRKSSIDGSTINLMKTKNYLYKDRLDFFIQDFPYFSMFFTDSDGQCALHLLREFYEERTTENSYTNLTDVAVSFIDSSRVRCSWYGSDREYMALDNFVYCCELLAQRMRSMDISLEKYKNKI